MTMKDTTAEENQFGWCGAFHWCPSESTRWSRSSKEIREGIHRDVATASLKDYLSRRAETATLVASACIFFHEALNSRRVANVLFHCNLRLARQWIGSMSLVGLTSASYIKAFRRSRFGFTVKSVKQESPPSTMYRIEGLSDGNVLFVLSCHSVPPGSYWKDLPREELIERLQRYDNIEAYRKNATERVNLASEDPKGVMLLFAGEEPKQQESNDPVDEGRRLVNEIFDQCAVLNRIPNGNGIFPVTVISSEFRNWKDRTGYEVEAQTEDESLTLACAQGKDQACHSLPPKAYRAIRRPSQGGDLVAFYDANLNPVAIYRILGERSLK